MRDNLFIVGFVIIAAALVGCESGDADQQIANHDPEPEVSFEPPPVVDPTTYYAHGHLLERQGQYERAIAQYEQALEIQPSFVEARNRLGIVLNELDRHPEATAQYRLALQDQPSSAQLHNNLGFSLYLEAKWQEAIESFNQALEYQPNFVRAEMNLGMAHGKMGSFATSLEHFRNAVPEADAQYNVAVLQTTAGDFAGAAASLEQALTARPNFVEARHQLRDIARKTAEAEAKRQLATNSEPPAETELEVNVTPQANAQTQAEESEVAGPEAPSEASQPSNRSAQETLEEDQAEEENTEQNPAA